MKQLVVKSNNLIEAKYKLTTNEQRIILYVLSEKVKKSDEQFGIYKFCVSDLVKYFGDGMRNFDEIIDIIKKLKRRELYFKEGEEWVIASWVSVAKVNENTKEITIEFPQLLKPYLLQLKSNFTSYTLENVVYLKSSYSIRMYELLKQYVKIKKRDFKLEELKESLGIPEGEYIKYSHFKNKVLDICYKQINLNSDVKFEYYPIKHVRKVVGISFQIDHQQIKRHPQLPTLEAPPFDQQDLFDRLIAYGASPSETEMYFKKYDVDKIERNLSLCEEAVKGDKIKTSKRGYLRKAMELDFAYVSPADIQENHDKQEIIEKIRIWKNRDSLTLPPSELEEIEQFITNYYKNTANRPDWKNWRIFLG